MFTDECLFTSAGAFNRQNTREWQPHNPHWVQEVQSKYKWSVMVWAGIMGNTVVGPYFFDRNVSSASYLHVLQDHLPIFLENISFNLRRNMWFQQDGASAHRSDNVVEHLDDIFANRWIGLRGPVFWPPFSPDLTPLDFFVWGFVKGHVYCEGRTPTTEAEARQLIREAFAQVTVNHLHAVQRSYIERIRLCIELHGGHFENVVICKRCNIFKQPN